MTKKEIINGNKLIAEFMDWKQCKDGDWQWKHPKNSILPAQYEAYGTKYTYDENMKFNSSWEWLMPVVDKIESLHFNSHIVRKDGLHYCIFFHYLMIPGLRVESAHHNYKINAIYEATIKFIELYNTKKK